MNLIVEKNGIGALLVEVLSPMTIQCTFSLNEAKKFETKKIALEYLKDNNIENYFKVVRKDSLAKCNQSK